MNPKTRVMITIVLIQAALVGVYWMVEYSRAPDASKKILSTQPPLEVQGSLKGLLIRNPNGSPVDLHSIKRPVLVHLWATWCAVCQIELPGLLQLPEALPVDVLAVALDRNWSDVERFLGRHPSARIALGDSAQIEAKLGVRVLPVTYLVYPGGRIRFLFRGPRDWTNADFLHSWIRPLVEKSAAVDVDFEAYREK